MGRAIERRYGFWRGLLVKISELGAPATREAILSAFDEGASLLSYLGHGGIHLWADENLLHIGQVSSLAAQSAQPLVLTMNCLNGYFHFPYFNSLAEELVKAEGKAAIAALTRVLAMPCSRPSRDSRKRAPFPSSSVSTICSATRR